MPANFSNWHSCFSLVQSRLWSGLFSDNLKHIVNANLPPLVYIFLQKLALALANMQVFIATAECYSPWLCSTFTVEFQLTRSFDADD